MKKELDFLFHFSKGYNNDGDRVVVWGRALVVSKAWNRDKQGC